MMSESKAEGAQDFVNDAVMKERNRIIGIINDLEKEHELEDDYIVIFNFNQKLEKQINEEE